MHIFKPLIHLGGIIHTFKNIPAKAGLVPSDSGWEFLKRRYVKHFSGSIEVRGGLPSMESEKVRSLAAEAVALAVEQYGDFLVDAQVSVVQGQLPSEKSIRTGYHSSPEDTSSGKKVAVEIIHDPKRQSYSISATALDHVIDGVPMFLLLQLIHNHILFGQDSLLKKQSRSWKWSHQEKIDYYGKTDHPAKKSAEHVSSASAIIPAGAFIDVTESYVTRLKKSISGDTGAAVPSSLVEEALLAMLLGLDFVQDCVSRHGSGSVASGRYDGLGFVRSRGFRNAALMSPGRQYAYLASELSGAAAQVPLERKGRGKVSVFLERYRRVPLFYSNFFDRRTSKEGVMVVSGHELLGSNLNGVDFGVPLCRHGVSEENIRFTFMPSHAEHNPAVYLERASKGRDPHITLFSFGCAPATTLRGRKIAFKSIKTARGHVEPYLLKWGYTGSYLTGLTDEKIVSLFYNEIYSPCKPLEGRLEKLAEKIVRAAAVSRPDHGLDKKVTSVTTPQPFFLTPEFDRDITGPSSRPAGADLKVIIPLP